MVFDPRFSSSFLLQLPSKQLCALELDDPLRENKQLPGDPFNSADISFLHHSSINFLLSLRSLSRSWAYAISPFVYRSLFLRTPWINGYLVKMWSTSVQLLNISILRTLCLENLMYIPATNSETFYGFADECRDGLEYEYASREPNCILMPDAVDIITLCGSKLEHLKLIFTRSVGFSDTMVVAINNLKSLKRLLIEGTMVRDIENDSKSLKAVLNNTVSIESLSLRILHLDCLDLEPGALPKLAHFWITCHPDNILAVHNFCATTGEGIRLLEYMPPYERDNAAVIISALQDSLEGIYFDTIPYHIPAEICIRELPKFRVVRCTYIDSLASQPIWFLWPIFRNLEVFITSYPMTREYWHEALVDFGNTTFRQAPKLKHFMFITWNTRITEDKVLERLFRKCGITCSFRVEMTPTEVLDFANRESLKK